MSNKRIGQFLGQFTPISDHDIDEILQEQSGSRTRKSFGDIALSLGLCRPEHITAAWCVQLLDGPPRKIDLDRVGIDTQALTHLSAQIASELNVIPVRLLGDVLIVAIASDSIALAASELPSRVTKQLRFALADPKAIRRAIEQHYALAAA